MIDSRAVSHGSEVIDSIREYDTPTIANAIERFDIRPRTEGIMDPGIRWILDPGPTIIGYACTARVSAKEPPTSKQSTLWMSYYEAVQRSPRPSIAVIQDVDPVPSGSFWGEVNVTVHMALGSIGTVTNGGVRDLNEVERMGFAYCASCLLVTHGHIHIEEFDVPVNVGGVEVCPGDLIAADRHGVLLIPNEIAPRLAEECRKAANAERPVIDGCRKAITERSEVNLKDLAFWRSEMVRLRAAK